MKYEHESAEDIAELEYDEKMQTALYDAGWDDVEDEEA